MKEHYWIPSRNRRLSAIVHTPEHPAGDLLVVVCHGFTGDKIGANQLLLRLALAMESAGIHVVRFDFAGSGESEGEFASDTTVSGWKEDLRSVIAWAGQQPTLAGLKVCLLGHSLGGYLACSYDDSEGPAAGKIALAPVVRPVENFQQIILGPQLWEQALRGETIANFYGKGFTLDGGFVRDLLKQPDLTTEPGLQGRCLIVHGAADIAVPIAGSQTLQRVSGSGIELHVLPDADHVFTGRIQQLQTVILNWLHNL
ncbi:MULTISPECIES: S9 family peptidase [unclassified Paenibacillus]|uniref:alpha/beta hydrolase family protein n=1 Tax=unclassified Paenibacillus TaxID=185978 RepID=UPI0006D0C31D|nr:MULTISPECIES: alpha/beta fold hydrolase [unclassified Paenibacillus]